VKTRPVNRDEILTVSQLLAILNESLSLKNKDDHETYGDLFA
jgi:hypothetical protein